jgi:hypothetical protein
MRPLLRRRALLQREDIAVLGGDVIFDAFRLTVDGFDVFHIVLPWQ